MTEIFFYGVEYSDDTSEVEEADILLKSDLSHKGYKENLVKKTNCLCLWSLGFLCGSFNV